MKNKYEMPTVEIIHISIQDVVTSSEGSGNAVLPEDDFGFN